MKIKRAKPAYFLIIIAIILALVIFSGLGWLNFATKRLGNWLTPVQSAFYRWGLTFTSFKNYKDLIDENSQLKKEVARLVIDYVRLNNLESENSYLRRELNFIQEKHFNYEVADIIGRQAYNDQILILAKGSADGLKVGQAITVDQGIIVGKILSTEDHRAYAALLTEVRSQLAVSLESLSGTNGLLLGRVGSSLLMDLIPQDKTVAKDNLVITSGLEEGIPRGLLVGRISQVDSLVGEVFKQARVEPSVNYAILQTVTVIK